MEKDYYDLHIIPDDERITLDVLSLFEVSSILSNRITQIGTDQRNYLLTENLYVDTASLSQNVKRKINPNEVITNGKGSFIKLSSTADIVKAEINTGNVPYLIHRVISRDTVNKIAYVEIVNPNKLAKPVLEYLSNLN